MRKIFKSYAAPRKREAMEFALGVVKQMELSEFSPFLKPVIKAAKESINNICPPKPKKTEMQKSKDLETHGKKRGEFRAKARNGYKRWELWEDEIAMNMAESDDVIASNLSRSLQAICARRVVLNQRKKGA